MAWSYFVTFLVVCGAYGALDSTSAQNIMDECVNNTLVLGDACQATAQAISFRNFKSSLEKDVALIVLNVAITDFTQNSRYERRFDLVKTDLGELLLTLKSQMEFLTIDLPLLSEKVDRRYLELVAYPPGCVSNITVNDILVRNWLLCVLTKNTDGIEHLVINKLCISKDYTEPNDWYLFEDKYYDECTDSVSINSTWVKLKEDPKVYVFKGFVNFGVSIITITGLLAFALYRYVHHTKERVFLYKLQNPREKVCSLSKCSDVKEDTAEFSPHEISCQWDNVEGNKQLHMLKINGFWLVAEKNEFISYNSFGLLDFIQICIEDVLDTEFCLLQKCCKREQMCCECTQKCCKRAQKCCECAQKCCECAQKCCECAQKCCECAQKCCECAQKCCECAQKCCECAQKCCKCAQKCCEFAQKCAQKCLNLMKEILLMLLMNGILVVFYVFYHKLPFHTLTDVIICIVISLPVQGAFFIKLCCNKYHIRFIPIFATQTFYFLAFLLLAILSRVTLIVYIGLSLKSGSNLYSLLSITVFFVLANGFYQLQKTYTGYITFLDRCMAEINSLVDESSTLKEPVFKSRIISSENDIWPTLCDKKLSLEFTKPVLLYMSNGDSAIKRRLFRQLCKEDTFLSPGSFRYTALKDFLKFIFWGSIVIAIVNIQGNIAKQFETSLYSQGPSTVLSGLLPLLLRVLFNSGRMKKENANFKRLVNAIAIKCKAKYRVIDFKMDGKPVGVGVVDPKEVWQNIHIKNNKCAWYFCDAGGMNYPWQTVIWNWKLRLPWTFFSPLPLPPCTFSAHIAGSNSGFKLTDGNVSSKDNVGISQVV